MMGIGGDGQGDDGSSLMKEKSGYLLTSMSTTLSGDEEGTKLSGLTRPDKSWTLKKKTHEEERDFFFEYIIYSYISWTKCLPDLFLVVVGWRRQGGGHIYCLGGVV